MPDAMPTVNPVALLLIIGLLASVVGAWIWAFLRFAFQQSVLPRDEHRIVPWGAKSVLAVIVVWLAVQVGVQKVFALATRGAGVPIAEQIPFTPSELMTASACQNAVVLLVVPVVLWLTCRARPSDFVTLGKRSGWQVLQGMATWPLMAPIIYGMMHAAVAIWGRESHPLETAIQKDGVGGKAVIFFLAGVVFAPAAEELIFRGVLLGWLTQLILKPRPGPVIALIEEPELGAEGMLDPTPVPPVPPDAAVDADNPYAPPWASLQSGGIDPTTLGAVRSGSGVTVRLVLANLGVSTLFAALHYTVWPTPVPIFFLSLALGVLYQRTGSLVAPVALHMTFNGISTILMFLLMGTNIKPDSAQPPPPPLPAPMPHPVDPITRIPVASIQVAGDDWLCRSN